MKQILVQLAKSVTIWLGLIVILAIIAIPLGFFSIQVAISDDKLLMGIYSPERLGTPAAFNPLVQALEGLGLIAFLLNPLAILTLRRWWSVRVRPWLLAIGGLILGNVLGMVFSISTPSVDITTESLWPEFWIFFSTIVFGLLVGYGSELLLARRKSTH